MGQVPSEFRYATLSAPLAAFINPFIRFARPLPRSGIRYLPSQQSGKCTEMSSCDGSPSLALLGGQLVGMVEV